MTDRDSGLFSARFKAAYLIHKYGIEAPEQIVLEDIAWARGVRVKCGSLQGAEAWLVRKGKQGLIRVSDRCEESGRRRFSIAHELGHWECHCSQSQAWICTTGDIHAYKGSVAEIEANAFAAELLMPRNMLMARVGNSSLTMDLICRLSAEFGTTLTATAVRLVEESKDDCCVVFSDRNRVRWSKKSSKAKDVWLPSIVGIESKAWDCDTGPQDARGPQKVPAEAWLSGRALQEYTEVWEESVFIPKYQVAITLLGFA